MPPKTRALCSCHTADHSRVSLSRSLCALSTPCDSSFQIQFARPSPSPHHAATPTAVHPLRGLCVPQSNASAAAAARLCGPNIPVFRPSGGRTALEIAKSVADVTVGIVDEAHSALRGGLPATRGVAMRQVCGDGNAARARGLHCPR